MRIRIDQDDQALRAAVIGFLQARGYAPAALGPYGLIAEAEGDRVIGAVVLDEDGPDPMAAAEEALAALQDAGAGAQGAIPVIKRTRRGLNLAVIKAAGGETLTPVAFFDWYFRQRVGDAGDDSSRLSRRLLRKVREFRVTPRAPQPYRRLDRLEATPTAPGALGSDLFEALAPELARFPDGPRLIVLCGPAGVGKSVLTAELLHYAHQQFNDAKQTNTLASRPILFEPLDFGAHETGTLRGLVERLYTADLSEDVPPAAFEWLHRQGLNTWIFDGLDEFYRRQSGFFERLEAALSERGSRARIVICTRDSLFTSTASLRSFLQRRLETAPDTTEIYELARWDAPAKRAFIEAVLHDAGVIGAPLRARADAVAERIANDPTLTALSDLPFYCARIVEAINRGDAAKLTDEFAVLQSMLDALIDREVGKGVIRLGDFVSRSEEAEIAAALTEELGQAPPPERLQAAIEVEGRRALEDILGLAAHAFRFQGISHDPSGEVIADDWTDIIAPVLMSPDLTPDAERRLELALAHFPVFSRGAEDGGLRFMHDLTADYLAAGYALYALRWNADNPRLWTEAMGAAKPLEGTVFLRRMARAFTQDPRLLAAGEALAASGALPDETVARLIQIRRAMEV